MKKLSIKKLIPTLISIGLALAFLFLFRFVFIIGYIPSESMEPTLHEGSFIVGIRFHGEIQKGNIVIFRHEGKLLVKRVAGVSGEIINLNGREVTVPEDCYVMLGDNVANSFDSRYWEDPFVEEKDIIAKVIK